MTKINPTQALLKWYYKNGRRLPWRTIGSAHKSPYEVWISEIMLQQTTVATVLNYFQKWMERFPTVQALATADIQDVLLTWQGMGYYTRARKIHECAKVLMDQYQGQIPTTRDELLKLPGIGPYSASSICCFAFNRPETVVDGNVIRVIARFYGIIQEVNASTIYPLAQKLTSLKHGADYASAIMDLGAMLCTPTNPKCNECPWHGLCIAAQKKIQNQIPKIKKLEKKEKAGLVYIIRDSQGRYLIRKRTEKGLLHGLWEFPWQEVTTAPIDASKVVHVFTHFKLTLYLTSGKTNICPDGIWVDKKDFKNYPFSKLMQKVVAKL
ncbi:MAG: A/G-specific adenine glycosylase [Alphaproteobacteria bacterium]|nr:A/G-specific adenine glycosylase [Alphaproteobacteria bacterium]